MTGRRPGRGTAAAATPPGEPISIRRARPDDAAAIARLMDEPVVYANLMQMPYASEEAHRTRIADSLRPGQDRPLARRRAGDGTIVGSAGMHPAGPALRRRHVVMIGLSVDRRARRGEASARR